jgi:predicted nucleic-acid-binding Zn-ribbon protein
LVLDEYDASSGERKRVCQKCGRRYYERKRAHLPGWEVQKVERGTPG